MGFYQPATLVKDAQRHGQHFRPVDVARSEWRCTIEHDREEKVVRLGFNYVKSFRKEAAEAIVAARSRGPFASIDDLARRVPEMRKDELTQLAQVGALNSLSAAKGHRRDSLWKSEAALRSVGPLFAALEAQEETCPLVPMTSEERLHADFRGTGLTIGRHPMAWHRERLNREKVMRAVDLPRMRNGMYVKLAGCVICRQRPGTAKGFLFLSIEDETGIANAIVEPDFYEKHRTVLITSQFLMLEGALQNMDNTVSVKVARVAALEVEEAAAAPSHDFR